MDILDEYDERGFGDCDGFTVCPDHIEDPDLKGALEEHLTADACSFCARTGTVESPVAATFESLMRAVVEAIRTEYTRPRDEGLDGAGWLVTMVPSQDVLDNICGTGVVDEPVMEQIREIFGDGEWIDADWAVLSEDKQLSLNWSTFVSTVKHESRFWFLRKPESSGYDPDELTPAEFFGRLEEILDSVKGAVTEIPAGAILYRGRMVNSDADPANYKAGDLGSPPARKAAANRMSPAGISMFYGSDSPETVVAEIGSHTSRSHAVIGAFETQQALRIVDLTGLPPVPGIFNQGQRDLRRRLRFLHEFAADLTKPVSLDGREHIDYVPTQIVTEYLRMVAEPRFHGVKVNSAQRPGGTNTVVFCDGDWCADEDDVKTDRQPKDLPGIHAYLTTGALPSYSWLVLKSGSVKKVGVIAAIK